MSKLVRFGISMNEQLLEAFDKKIVSQGYANRSEAVRDLIRNRLVEMEWEDENQEVAGTITLMYDHHVRGLSNLLTELQHNWHDMILTSTHVHLDHHNCLEVLVLKGPAGRAREVADKLISVKGVKHGQLTITSTGHELR
ncbi:nickel-responsive transcriptional regulator NikR [Dethiobacter alkaliphilus]|uniref:Putative nickel-responsive regulator n=1 Tax=Dethiobacter alkaliphilus AHT 1 TaxID=555088 RepID=C0GGF1_DETAL|nr:nickel-responsive transcriptional regulator NikR [Dethiobacter alkaliphilus]EEG77581.1 putative transcriptional regulator, CopG family [Dethiobacter alkaliphilus AHT 1]MCW3488885.1 nickel-responsive transcriptional regulator NikR [Dethiobacter alkaliphilus]